MYKLRLLLLLPIALMAGCAGLQDKDTDDFDPNEPLYEAEHSGAGIRLAVLPPEGINLRDRDVYLLDQIQGSVNEDFNKYSAMTLINQSDLELLKKQLDIATSEYYSEDDFISIGKFTNAQFIVHGRLTAVTEREFTLVLTITDQELGEVKATYQKNLLTVQAMKQGAIKEFSRELLEQMGVRLTAAGKYRMEAEAQASAGAQAKLAKSRAADRAGNKVEGLINAYGAMERNPSLLEAEDQLKAATNAMTAGNLGLEIKDDALRRRAWKEQLTQFETYYRDYHPFDIWLVNVPEQKGVTNYDANTANFESAIGLQPSGELGIMQKVLRLIDKDLTKTKNKKKWGFGGWPLANIEYNLYRMRKIPVIVGLFNDQDEEIQRTTVNLYSQLTCNSGNTIRFDASQKLTLQFNNVNLNALTGDMKIRLISIDGMDAYDAEEDGYWTINPVTAKRFPKGKRVTIPEKERLIPPPPQPIAEAKPSAAPKPQPKPQTPKPSSSSWDALPLENRFGLSFNGLFNPITQAGDTTLAATIDIGFKAFTMEGIFHWPVNNELYDSPGAAAANVYGFGGGLGYTIIRRYLLTTLSFGVTYTGLDDKGIYAPYGQLKFNIMPWQTGLGLRFGFMAEASSVDWGSAYTSYYRWPLVENGAFRMNGKIMAGLVLWL